MYDEFDQREDAPIKKSGRKSPYKKVGKWKINKKSPLKKDPPKKGTKARRNYDSVLRTYGRDRAEAQWGVTREGRLKGKGYDRPGHEATRRELIFSGADASSRADSSYRGRSNTRRSTPSGIGSERDKYNRAVNLYGAEIANRRFPQFASGSSGNSSSGTKNYRRNKDGNIGWSDYQRDKNPGESYDDFNARHGGSGNRSQSNVDPFAAEDAKNTTPQGYYHEKPAPGIDKYRRGTARRREGDFTTHYSPNTNETHYEPRFEDAGPDTVTREDSGTFFDDEHNVRRSFQDPKAEKERKWVDDWYSHPATKERWKRLGRDPKDLDLKLKSGLAAGVNQGGAGDASGTYHPSDHRINIAHGDHGYDALAHEYAHATGIDKDQGGILEGILGRPKSGSDYFARGPEMYGWITDIRKDMGVKPGQKITPAMIQKASKTSRDAQRLLKEFDVSKITKAMNTVADNSSQQQDDSAFARKSPFTRFSPYSRMGRTKKYWCE